MIEPPKAPLTLAQVKAFRAAERAGTGAKPAIVVSTIVPTLDPMGVILMKELAAMPIASILQILMEVLAAAPGVESTIEEAMTAFNSSSAGTAQKISAIGTAASQLATVAAALVPPAPVTSAGTTHA